MNLEKIVADRMQTGKIMPHEAVEMRVQLSGLYSFYSSQLEDILIRKPNAWFQIRNNGKHKSDKSADREWETTEDGKNEIGLSMRLKRIEKMLSSLKTISDMSIIDYHHTK